MTVKKKIIFTNIKQKKTSKRSTRQVSLKKDQYTFSAPLRNIVKEIFQDSFKSFFVGLGLLLLFFSLASPFLVKSHISSTHSQKVFSQIKSIPHLSNIIAVPPKYLKTISKEQKVAPDLQKKYTVVVNDTLWSIAEKSYGSGFNWKAIAQANTITDPTTLKAGQKLIIPQVKSNEAIAESQVLLQKPVVQKYTVKPGDSLWSIAEANYHSGYAWSLIAEANNLQNPSVIYVGNIFKLPPPPSDKTIGLR